MSSRQVVPEQVAERSSTRLSRKHRLDHDEPVDHDGDRNYEQQHHNNTEHKIEPSNKKEPVQRRVTRSETREQSKRQRITDNEPQLRDIHGPSKEPQNEYATNEEGID